MMSSQSGRNDRDDFDVPPPARPPPLLSSRQLDSLFSQGHLDISLPHQLSGTLERLFAASADFFALPQDAKHDLYPSAIKSTEHGYLNLPGEKEYLTVRCRRESTPTSALASVLDELIVAAWHDMAVLLHRALVDIGLRLGGSLASDISWDTLIAGRNGSHELPSSLREATETLMRIFRYEPGEGEANRHCDLGLLTLCVARGKGLQVFDWNSATSDGNSVGSAEKYWRDAGTATLLVGHTLRVVSGNQVRAGWHRVVATERGRRSIVLALRPDTKGMIDLRAMGGQGFLEGQTLWDRIREGKVSVNIRQAVQEEQRREAVRKRALQM